MRPRSSGHGQGMSVDHASWIGRGAGHGGEQGIGIRGPGEDPDAGCLDARCWMLDAGEPDTELCLS